MYVVEPFIVSQIQLVSKCTFPHNRSNSIVCDCSRLQWKTLVLSALRYEVWKLISNFVLQGFFGFEQAYIELLGFYILPKAIDFSWVINFVSTFLFYNKSLVLILMNTGCCFFLAFIIHFNHSYFAYANNSNISRKHWQSIRLHPKSYGLENLDSSVYYT